MKERSKVHEPTPCEMTDAYGSWEYIAWLLTHAEGLREIRAHHASCEACRQAWTTALRKVEACGDVVADLLWHGGVEAVLALPSSHPGGVTENRIELDPDEADDIRESFAAELASCAEDEVAGGGNQDTSGGAPDDRAPLRELKSRSAAAGARPKRRPGSLPVPAPLAAAASARFPDECVAVSFRWAAIVKSEMHEIVLIVPNPPARGDEEILHFTHIDVTGPGTAWNGIHASFGGWPLQFREDIAAVRHGQIRAYWLEDEPPPFTVDLGGVTVPFAFQGEEEQ